MESTGAHLMAQLQLLPQQPGVVFDDSTHRYRLWSERWQRWFNPSSVSQILTISGAKAFDPTHWKRSLMTNEGMSDTESELFMDLHRDGRARIGTDLHGLIRQDLDGTRYRPRFAEALMLLATWRREFGHRIGRVIQIESPMISPRLFFAGTPDLVAEVDGRWWTGDWKSKVSADVATADAAWPLQGAGYDILLEDVCGHFLKSAGIEIAGFFNLMIWPVKAKKVNPLNTGVKPIFYNRADMSGYREKFMDALRTHHRIKAEQGCREHQYMMDFLPATPGDIRKQHVSQKAA